MARNASPPPDSVPGLIVSAAFLQSRRPAAPVHPVSSPMAERLPHGPVVPDISRSGGAAWTQPKEEEKIMRKALIALLLAGTFTMAACNTVEGAGKDVESAGEAVQDAAN